MAARKASKLEALERVVVSRKAAQAGLSRANASAGVSSSLQVVKSPLMKKTIVEVTAATVEDEPQATRNVGQEDGKNRVIEREKEEEKSGKKRKFDKSIGSPLDVRRRSRDWDGSENLHQKGKEISAIIEDLSEEEWEEEVKKMEV